MKYVKLYALVFSVIFGLGITSAEARTAKKKSAKISHTIQHKKHIKALSHRKSLAARKTVKAVAPLALASAPVNVADASTEFFKPCVETAYMKSTLNRSQSEQACSHIQNKYALACTQIAINYIRIEDQGPLVNSCSSIQTEEGLTCMIQNAVTMNNSPASSQKIINCASSRVAAK